MDQSKIMEMTEQYVQHTYNRFPISIDRGDGVRVWDSEGKEYLDFMAGIAVYALGYHFPGYDEALKAQIDKVLHTSNLYYHEPLALAARDVVTSTGLSKVFFTNSGAEAIEGAIKSARKYAWLKDGKKSVMALVNDRTCAIIMETIQGEGGIYPADPEFIRGIRKICDEKDILLILDEIQCGMGRSGRMWAYEEYGIEPDIVTCAKALGCGVPVGAFVLNEKTAMNSMVPGDHGTTYGGNPFVCSAVHEVFELFEKHEIVKHVQAVAPYLTEKLEALMAAHPDKITDRRGRGLIQGLELAPEVPVGEITKKALAKGLLIISASGNVLRFVPPLIVTEKDIDCALAILEECF